MARRVRRIEPALELYGREYVVGQDCVPERRKVIDRGTTLSPHDHRRERQIRESRSVTVVKMAAVQREYWPLHRSTVLLFVEYGADGIHLYASHRKLKHAEEIRLDELDSPKNQDVLDELEFLLEPLLKQLPDTN